MLKMPPGLFSMPESDSVSLSLNNLHCCWEHTPISAVMTSLRKQMNYCMHRGAGTSTTFQQASRITGQKHTVTLGLSYALTPSEHIPPYTIINQTPEVTSEALLSAQSYSIVLGYTYYFARAE